MVLSFRSDALGRKVKIADGGESTLYSLPDLSIDGVGKSLVYKEYKPALVIDRGHPVAHALAGLVGTLEKMPEQARARVQPYSAWPVAVVMGNDGATGLVMPHVGAKYFGEMTLLTGRKKMGSRDLDKYLQPDSKITALGFVPLTAAGRKIMLTRILGFLDRVHMLGYIVGDISQTNILMHVDPTDQLARNQPKFVDVDTFRPVGGVSAMPQRHTPSWEPPEAEKWSAVRRNLLAGGADIHAIADARAKSHVQTLASDVYKAGLVAIRLYDTSDSRSFAMLSNAALAHINSTFGRPAVTAVTAALAQKPSDRPTMAELFSAFRNS